MKLTDERKREKRCVWQEGRGQEAQDPRRVSLGGLTWPHQLLSPKSWKDCFLQEPRGRARAVRRTGMALGGLGTLGSLRHPGLGKSAFHGYFTVICHTNLPLIPTPDWLAQDISVSAPGLAYGEPAPLSPLWFAGPSLWSGAQAYAPGNIVSVPPRFTPWHSSASYQPVTSSRQPVLLPLGHLLPLRVEVLPGSSQRLQRPS